MGFFSWMTCDTNESISNQFSSRGAKTVYLLQPNGEPSIKEDNYEGYGDFGGVDAYVWLAEANGLGNTAGRDQGIALHFSGEFIEFPLKFSFNENAIYENYLPSENCPDQGYFYDDDIEDDEEYDYEDYGDYDDVDFGDDLL